MYNQSKGYCGSAITAALLKFMEPWKNLSLENLQETVEGVFYIEKWKPIIGFEKYYHASDFGRIKGLARKWVTGNTNSPREKGDSILKQTYKKNGELYLKIDLSVNGKRTSMSIHRIIATLFCENPYNYPEPNHLDSNPINNRARNLVWATRKQNVQHSFEEGFRESMNGINNLNAVVNDDLVRIIRKEYAEGGVTHRELGAKYGVGHTTIRHIIIGKTWKHVTN